MFVMAGLLEITNQFNMKKKLAPLIIMSLNVALSYSQQVKKAQIYITPRYVDYGWGDNGVFHFKLRKKSIKSLYEDKSYFTPIVKDKGYMNYIIRKLECQTLCIII